MNVNDMKEMEVSDPWASFIFSGRKKVEVRKNNPNSWGALKEGDILRIKNRQTEEQRQFRVVECRPYRSLLECYFAEGVRNLLPGKSSAVEANEIYLGFDGSSEKEILQRQAEFDQFGCIAIELTPEPGVGDMLCTRPSVKGLIAPAEPKLTESDAPRRPMSAYLYFTGNRRPLLKAEQPDLPFGDLTKLIADEWEGMSDADRAPYRELSRLDHERWELESAAFEQKTATVTDPTTCPHVWEDGTSATFYYHKASATFYYHKDNEDSTPDWEKKCSRCGTIRGQE